MINTKMLFGTRITTPALFVAAAVALACVALGGCAGHSESPPPAAASKGKSGTQIWADNCMRCHNMRSPDAYSSGQWELIVQHMRLRANLTGEEQRKVTEFLKAAN